MTVILTKPLITKRLHLLFIGKIVWGGRETDELTVDHRKHTQLLSQRIHTRSHASVHLNTKSAKLWIPNWKFKANSQSGEWTFAIFFNPVCSTDGDSVLDQLEGHKPRFVPESQSTTANPGEMFWFLTRKDASSPSAPLHSHAGHLSLGQLVGKLGFLFFLSNFKILYLFRGIFPGPV